MVRPILLATSLFLALALFAQSWCPPGATWDRSVQAFAFDGYKHQEYTGDTMMGGRLAQRIHETGTGIDYFQDDTIAFDDYRFTSVEDSLVLLWVQVDGVWTWDTLYRFDARIGDRWFPAGWDSTLCSNPLTGMLQVVDTGNIIVSGHVLRSFTLNYLDYDGLPTLGCGRYMERLGYEYGLDFQPGGCTVPEYSEALRCYNDFEIEHHAPWWTYGCGSFLGIQEGHRGEDLSMFPNPGSDHFNLQLPSGSDMITMCDATGRIVLVQRDRGGMMTVDASHLPLGTYVVTAVIEDASVFHLTWVKQ